MSELSNPQEERVILGQLMQAESAFWTVSDVLRQEHFSRPIHGAIFAAIRDILTEGKHFSIAVLLARLGPEYEDGKSTSALVTGILRDADKGDLEGVDTVIDLWRHRRFIAALEDALKEAKKQGQNSFDLVANHQTVLSDITMNSQVEPIETIGQVAEVALRKSRAALETGRISGFDTGLPSLDEIMGRIHVGDLGVIGASQGSGKTILGLQIAARAQAILPTALFELEMSKEDLARRELAARTSLSASQIEEGAYDMYAAEELVAAMALLKDARIYLDARPKLRLDQIRDRAIWLKRAKGLGLVVVDHIRLVRAVGKFQNKFDRIEHVTGELKAMAKDLEIAVIALSQVTRMSQRRDDPSPQINDLDGGSSIEQDADWIVGMFRRDLWLKGQRPYDMESKEGREWAERMVRHKGRIEITALKRRRGESGEMREFNFDGRRSRVTEIER